MSLALSRGIDSVQVQAAGDLVGRVQVRKGVAVAVHGIVGESCDRGGAALGHVFFDAVAEDIVGKGYRVGATARLVRRNQPIGAVVAILPDDAGVGRAGFAVFLDLLSGRIIFVRPIGIRNQLVIRADLISPGVAIADSVIGIVGEGGCWARRPAWPGSTVSWWRRPRSGPVAALRLAQTVVFS